jgi:hypothetical protein
MPHEEWDAQAAIADAPVRRFQSSVWRTHWREVGAMDWQLSLRTSGRYHCGLDLFPPDQVWPALYTSLAPELAIWEMVRRSAARNLAYLRNNVLTELAVDLARVLDCSDPVVVGLTRSDVTGPDHRLCHALAEAATAQGYEALLAPSAALPGTNLVVFPQHVAGPLPIRVVRSTELPLDSIAEDTGE